MNLLWYHLIVLHKDIIIYNILELNQHILNKLFALL